MRPRAVAAYRMRQRPPGWQRSGKSIAVRRLIRRVFLTVYYGEVAPHWLARRQFQSWLAHSCRTKLLTHKSPNPLQGPYAPQSSLVQLARASRKVRRCASDLWLRVSLRSLSVRQASLGDDRITPPTIRTVATPL